MKRFFLVISGCVLASLPVVLTLSCEKTLDGGSATISGTVLDSLTKSPLAQAWLVADDTLHVSKLYTDSVGNYKWPSRGTVNVTLFVGKEGYRTKWRFFPVVSGEMRDVDFELVTNYL